MDLEIDRARSENGFAICFGVDFYPNLVSRMLLLLLFLKTLLALMSLRVFLNVLKGIVLMFLSVLNLP